MPAPGGMGACHTGGTRFWISTDLIIFVVIAPAAQSNFLALWLRLFVHADPPTRGGDCLQLLQRVVPLAFDCCAFIEIELLRVV